MQNFNGLDPAQTERLAILAEECGEVIQMVGKILRHGYYSCHPDDVGTESEKAQTNKSLLEKELGDLEYIISLMYMKSDINDSFVLKAKWVKEEKIKKYLHHQW